MKTKTKERLLGVGLMCLGALSCFANSIFGGSTSLGIISISVGAFLIISKNVYIL